MPGILPYEAFWMYVGLFVFVSALTILIGYILARRNPSPVKEATFECGQEEDIHPHETYIRGADRYFAYAVAFFILDAFTWILIAAVKAFNVYLGSFVLAALFLAAITVALYYYVSRVREVL